MEYRKTINPFGRFASMIGARSTWFIITFLKHKLQGVIRKAYYAQYPFGFCGLSFQMTFSSGKKLAANCRLNAT
jgi:hypothetical protein